MKEERLPLRPLNDAESRHHRDKLRSARYAALANAEGFEDICFALEALGLRLLERQGDLGKYQDRIGFYAERSPILKELALKRPHAFKGFDALYEIVRNARNDNMHGGAYARHATLAAVELCVGLEEALMQQVKRTVGNLMVKHPISVQPWQTVAEARQLMLMHSFSFLPMYGEAGWGLLSELSVAKFLNGSRTKKNSLLGMSVEAACKDRPGLIITSVDQSRLLTVDMTIDDLLALTVDTNGPTLWLVMEPESPSSLAGVLSPFELM